MSKRQPLHETFAAIPTISRRAALRGFAGTGMATALAVAARGDASATSRNEIDVEQIEPTAGSWTPWLMSSGDQFRPAPPPDEAATSAELDDLVTLAAGRDDAALDAIAYWNAGAPAYRWNDLTIQHLLTSGIGGPRATRALALVNVAVADATIAAWDAKYTFNRPRPAIAMPALATVLRAPASPAYPSEHAVAAGAASTVLGSLFPDDAAMFSALAEEAGSSRLLAGTDYPSDVTTGMDLGRQIAKLAIARAQADGSDIAWAGSVPDEPGKWSGTKPAEPTAGTWQTWVLERADQFRPGPPPAFDSDQLATELAEVKSFERTNLTNLTASYWEYYGGRASFELYTNLMSQKLFEARLDDNPPRAARAYAMMDIALCDVFTACWDAKYAYWAIRPTSSTRR